MPVSEFHRQVAAVALSAAARRVRARRRQRLIAHGVIDRVTEDVDLFTDQEHGVSAAAAAVEDALRDAGFQTDREDNTAGLADVFEEMGDGLAEWTVTAPGGQQMICRWPT